MFESMGKRLEERRALAVQYAAGLSGLVQFCGHDVDAETWPGRPNFYKLPVLPVAEGEGLGLERKALAEALAGDQIQLGSGVYDFVTPRLPVFGERYVSCELPQTSWYAAHHICLPMHNALSVEDVARVVDAVRRFARG